MSYDRVFVEGDSICGLSVGCKNVKRFVHYKGGKTPFKDQRTKRVVKKHGKWKGTETFIYGENVSSLDIRAENLITTTLHDFGNGEPFAARVESKILETPIEADPPLLRHQEYRCETE